MYRCVKIFISFFLFSPFFTAKNRTSPSSTSLHRPTNIDSKISVSPSNLKQREESSTVCCYSNSRSQSVYDSDHSAEGIKSVANRSRVNFGFSKKSFLKDKIKRFENSPNNINENIKNRSTTTIKTEVATADPVKSVGESDQRIFDDENSSFSSTVLINRDEIQSNRKPSSICNLKFVCDSNNNRIKELQKSPCEPETKSSLNVPRQLRDTRNINIRCCANGEDIKVKKVIIRQLAPIVVRKKPQVEEEGDLPHNSNSFDYNNFGYIDASSRSSSSFSAFDDIGLCDEKVNQKTARTPNTFENCNLRQELRVKTSAKQNIYSPDQSYATIHQNAAQLKNNLDVSKNGLRLRASTKKFEPSNFNRSFPENLVSFSLVFYPFPVKSDSSR